MARVPIDRSAAPALGPVPAFTFPGIERHVLPNGLKVRTVEHTSAPVLTTTALEANGEYSVRVRVHTKPRTAWFLWPWDRGSFFGNAKFTFIP